MNRTFVAVVLAAAVVLAGCSGVFGGGGSGGSTPTITPVAVPTDEPTPTPVPDLAPGLTGRGIENATALVAAHTSALANTSFTKTTNTTGVASNGSVLATSTSTLRAGPVDEGVYSIFKRNVTDGYSPYPETLPVRTEVWSNDEQIVLNRTYANGTTAYDRSEISPEERFGTAGAGLRYRLKPFGTANTSVTRRERNGTTLYLVRGKLRRDGPGIVSLRLLVDGRGVIHRYRTVQRAPHEMNVSRIVHKARLSGIGTTDAPERPSWVDKALNRTASVPNRTPVSPATTTGTTQAETTTERNATATVDTTTRR